MILFSTKSNLQQARLVGDIVEAMGEQHSYDTDWKSIIYQTVRHLNEKIHRCTGIDKFILYDNKTFIVNPKYLDLK